MNILYFSQLFYPVLYGGGEFVFFQWSRELARRGHKVFVVTQKLEGTPDFEVVGGVKVSRVGPAIRYEGRLPPKVFENVGYVVEAVVKGISVASRNSIDIVHSNTYAPALAGQFCASILGKPHIVTFHDVYFLGVEDFWARWSSQTGMEGILKAVGPLLERMILRLPVSTFHTVSRTSKADILRCNVGRHVVVIPNGIDIADYEGADSSNPYGRQSIFIGRMIFYKNLDTVIYAFRKVLREVPDARFVLVGDGPERKRLEELVSTLDISRNVLFTGRVSHEEKVKLLKDSSFLVLPSLVEGFGITVIEAFACRKPVLVSNVMPLPEITEDGRNGFSIPPFDVDEWAEKMIYLLQNPSQTRRMGLKGYEKLTRHYFIEKVVDQLEQLYRLASSRSINKGVLNSC